MSTYNYKKTSKNLLARLNSQNSDSLILRKCPSIARIVGIFALFLSKNFLRHSSRQVFRGPRKLLFSLILCFTPAQISAQLFNEDFDSKSSSEFLKKVTYHDLLQLVEGEGPEGSSALKVTYQPTSRGSERISINLPLSKGVDEASLSYDVKFDSDFQFVRGGKLPGLGSANPVAGGGSVGVDQWSARLMWYRENGTLITYVYHQDQPKKTGDLRRAKEFEFKKGKYYSVTIYLKLNGDETENDGFVEVYIDGKKVVEHKEIRLRADMSKDTLISTLMFSTFHGGADKSWAPTEPVIAFFDNFEVQSGRVIRRNSGSR